MLKRIISLFQTPKDQQDRQLFRAVKVITGERPFHFSLYKLAMRHSSAATLDERGLRESNERLEYLGDAILGMVVAEFLFTHFPFKEEGFLTEVRARIVNREVMNELSAKLGLNHLVRFHPSQTGLSSKSMYGNTLEALIAAVYLDKGFKFCRRFIIRRMIMPHFDLNDLVNTPINHKSMIIEWSQKENRKVSFEIIQQGKKTKHGQFVAQVFIDNKGYRKGYGFSKKKAEQDAARKTIEHLAETKRL